MPVTPQTHIWMITRVAIFSHAQDGCYKFMWNRNLFSSSSYWDLSSSESWRCFESGSVMNNASTQRALPLPVRSQAGWANMGQHLQRKPGSVEPRNIKARIGTRSRHSLCVESRLTSSPVGEPFSSTWKRGCHKSSPWLIYWERLINVRR